MIYFTLEAIVPLPEDGQQSSQSTSSERSMANYRFAVLFARIIDECSITRGPKPKGAQLWTAILPRIESWEPTKPDDIENVLNRIYVTQSSGWSVPELNMQEVAIADLADSGTYLSKEFRINGGVVGITISHLRIRPGSHERPCISITTAEQAPLDILTFASDEIEQLLPKPTASFSRG